MNRLVSIAYPDSQYDVAFLYDQGNAVTGCATSWPIGRLTRMQDGSGSTTYCYDHRGNVAEKRQAMNNPLIPVLTVRYTYDLSDRVIRLRYPSGRDVDYARDGVGRISGVQLTRPGATAEGVVSGITYLPFGPATSFSFANGQTLTKSYDQDYRTQGVSSPAVNLAFDLDAVGNIVASGPSSGNWVESYDYDDLYRLTDVKDGGGTIPFDRFAYDATGNRIERQKQGGWVVPYAYPAGSHRLESIGGSPRDYDAMGNTTYSFEVGAQLTYGDHGRMSLRTPINGTPMVYIYNGRGERVLKAPVGQYCTNVCPGEIFVYDEAGRLLGEYSTSGSARQEHIWVDDTPVAMLEGNKGQVYYVHSDHLNTPRALSDGKEYLRWRWAFHGNAFGELEAETDPMPVGQPVEYNLRFPGQYFDAESGLHYNYFRDYEPGTGRYVESDPIGLRGGPSTFSYANGNSLSFVDHKGLSACSNCPGRSDRACCQEAVRNGVILGRALGQVICCSGRHVACVRPDLPSSSAGESAIRDCALEHERTHIRLGHGAPCSGCNVYSTPVAPGFTRGDAECEAVRAEITCLRSRQSRTRRTNPGWQAIEDAINSRAQYANSFGACNVP